MDLIYEGHKILPYCPRCSTPLSNFEANQGYEDVNDPAITVRFKSKDEERLATDPHGQTQTFPPRTSQAKKGHRFTK